MENQPTEPVATEAVPAAEPAPAVTPPKKSKKGLIIGIIIAVVAVVAVIVLAIVFLFGGIMGAGSAEATSFVNHIKNNRFEEAYEYFSPQLKEVQDFDTFSTTVSALGMNPSCEYKANSAEINAGTSGNTKETSGRIDCDDRAFTAEFKFIEIETEYKLYMYDIKPTALNSENNNNNGDRGSMPRDMESLRAAMLNKEALYCTVTHPEEGETLIQTNKGWTKMFMTHDGEDGKENVLVISGDGIYAWSADGAFKMAYDGSFMDGIMEEFDIDNADMADAHRYRIRCSNPNRADFSLPAGVKFTDVSEY